MSKHIYKNAKIIKLCREGLHSLQNSYADVLKRRHVRDSHTWNQRQHIQAIEPTTDFFKVQL